MPARVRGRRTANQISLKKALTMYKVIGTDGKNYGPATADQIRQWIRENRMERQTPLLASGAADWTFAGLHPEFANDFPPATVPPLIAPASVLIPQVIPLQRCSMAKAGLVCGILSVTIACCCGGLPFNLLGLVFSIIALVQISENPQRYGGRDMAILGLVLSTLGFLILMVATVIK